MDWKQFLASLVGSLAWPVAIVTVLILFRVQVQRLIAQIRRIGAGGVNVELAEQVEKVRDAGELVEEEHGTNIPDIVLDPAILLTAKTFPDAAFLQSFKQLESVILQIRARLPDDRAHRNLNGVLKQLVANNYITESVVALFQRLREARNTALHEGDKEMTQGEAIELIRQVRFLEELLRQVLQQLPPGSRIK